MGTWIVVHQSFWTKQATKKWNNFLHDVPKNVKELSLTVDADCTSC